MKGYFIINNKVWKNNIMDNAVAKVMRTVIDINEKNSLLTHTSIGTDGSDPKDRSLTQLKNEVGSKIEIGSWSVNAVYPFDLEVTSIIPDGTLAVGVSIKELGIWFGPVDNPVLFARAVDPAGVIVESGKDTVLTYNFTLV